MTNTTNSNDNTTDTTTENTEQQQRTATNSFRFSGESGNYQAFRPGEWSNPQEILFSEFNITETDLRVKTAEFKSPHYIDLTNGRACCWIQRKHGENFGGVILKCKRESETGLYHYTCQDWNRLLTNKVYVVLNGEWTVYKIITKLLVKCNLSTDGLLAIEKYDGMNEEVPDDDDPQEKVSSTTTITTTSSSTDSEDKEKTKKQNSEKETKLMKGNSFRQKTTGLYDKLTAREFILTLLLKQGVNIDIHMDENGVLHFDRYEKDTWLKERWYFVDHEIYDAQLTFDITDIITQVAVKHVDQLDGEATLYTSEKMLGVNIAAFFGVMGTVIDNPVKSSNNTTVATGDGFTVTGMPSAGKCCARANGGVMPPYKKVTRTYRNYCPNCKGTNCLSDNPKGVYEHEITCKKCDSDFCCCCGYDKNGTCRSRLTPAGSVSTTATSSSTASTGGSVSDTSSVDTTSADTSDSNIAVENYYKNKIAARIAFSESIRKWFTFTIKLAGEYKKLHTNSFCMFMMSDTFTLENLPTIGKKLNGKYTRYVGYEKNRYYIEKVVTTCDNNVGLNTELTLNPFASDYSTYARTQVQAEEALASALGGGGGISGDLIGIGKALAAKYTFSQNCQNYACMKQKGTGSCWSWSEAMFTELKAAGYKVRVIQYATSQSSRHRSVQYLNNGVWTDYPYREAGIPTGARATSSKPGMFVYKDWNESY